MRRDFGGGLLGRSCEGGVLKVSAVLGQSRCMVFDPLGLMIRDAGQQQEPRQSASPS